MGSDLTVSSPGSLPDARKGKGSRRGSPIFGFLAFIVLPLAALIAHFKFVLPAILERNERTAMEALKRIATAEAEFRSNDLDGNGINDFWTGDVAGLYSIRKDGRPISLINQKVAEADSNPLKPLTPKPVAYHGYYFIALDWDLSSGSPEPLKLASYDSMGKVHNPSSFGFCAYPECYGWTGRYTYIINDGNTMFRFDRGGKPFNYWPTDLEIDPNCHSYKD